MTPSPWVTWPSPASTTLPPRRTLSTVVERIFSGFAMDGEASGYHLQLAPILKRRHRRRNPIEQEGDRHDHHAGPRGTGELARAFAADGRGLLRGERGDPRLPDRPRLRHLAGGSAAGGGGIRPPRLLDQIDRTGAGRSGVGELRNDRKNGNQRNHAGRARQFQWFRRWVGLLAGFAAGLLAVALAGQGLLEPHFLAGLEVKGVALDFLDDVFLLHLAFEAAQRVFQGFAFLQTDFSQYRSPLFQPFILPRSCCQRRYSSLRLRFRARAHSLS